jgi:hypothetical protein
MDWDALDLEALRDELWTTLAPADAARTIYAFEEVVRAARIDDDLLDCVLAAAVCLKAKAVGGTPRYVLEQLFRRSVSDREWHDRYAALLS